MNSFDQLAQQAQKAGFTLYGSFNEGDLQHDTFTCLKGKFDGEVIDIYYNFYTGIVSNVTITSQFPENHPHYSPVKFKFN